MVKRVSGKRYGGLYRTAEYFGVSFQMISKWLKVYPERPRDEADYSEALNKLSGFLDKARYAVRDVKRIFENSSVVDLMDLRLNRELLGESIEQQRQRVLETVAAAGKGKRDIEKRLEELDNSVYWVDLVLKEYGRKASL
ncbi:MAG: hypothetical protein ACTSYO_09560 [Candidatus Ranarchaeia archaeon]